MKMKTLLCYNLILFLFLPLQILKAQEYIPFDSDEWQITNGKIVEHLGRQCLIGNAYLKDAEFKDGIIEYDVCVTGARSYPGVNFRVQAPGKHEHFYIRPHRAGLYPDALQYTPSTNGNSAWQLYSGFGYTNPVELPKNEWVSVRLEVKDSQARVFLNDVESPVLEMFKLKHEPSVGTIGLAGPTNGSAYFSNFRFSNTIDLVFDQPPAEEIPAGMIMDWELSQAFQTTEIEFDQTPQQQGLSDLVWQKVKASNLGLVDVSDCRSRTGRAADMVFARTIIESDKAQVMELKFGYSDAIMVFLNGQQVYFGNSGYTVRDPSFLGIIGLNDAVFLPLSKGKNELMLGVAESFGGWGFMCQDGNAIFLEEGIKEVWSTGKVFNTSESILYDPEREVLYVTNFDQFTQGNPEVLQFISKLSLDGEVLELKWVDSLNHPLGMTFYKDKIYVAERGTVAIIDPGLGLLIKRLIFEGSLFLNDIAVDESGTIFISDTRKNVIWKSEGDSFIPWLEGGQISGPNVLYIHDGELLIGNSNSGWLVSVNIASGETKKVARFPEGFIDGIRPDGFGNLLVSIWRGLIYRVSPDGEMELIFNTTNKGYYCADFEYIPEKNLLIVPTFFENSVKAYHLKSK